MPKLNFHCRIILALLCCLAPQSPAAGATGARELNGQAVAALEAGDAQTAIGLLLKADRVQPNQLSIKKNLVIAYNTSAMDQARRGNLSAARRLFQKALELSAADSDAITRRNLFATLNNHAVARVEQGDYEAAENLFHELEQQTGFISDLQLLKTYQQNYLMLLVRWGRQRLEAGEFNAGRNLLYRAIAREPENLAALRLLGDHFYEQDLFGLARVYYVRAAKCDPRNREYYGQRVRQCALDLKFEQGAQQLSDLQQRFLISYSNYVSVRQVEQLLDQLGAAYFTLKTQLGREPRAPIRVKVYDNGEFYTMHGLPHWAGGFFDGKLRVPAQLLARGDEAVRRVAFHEMAHVFLSNWLGEKLEFWLHEGLAQYFEGDAELTAAERETLREIVQFSRHPFDEIRTTEFESFKNLQKVREAYAHSEAFVRYLIETRGIDRMKRFLNLISRGTPNDQATQDAFGRPIEDLHVEWRKWGRAQY